MAVLAGSSLPLTFLILGLVINEFNGFAVVNPLTQTPPTPILNTTTPYFCNILELYPDYVATADPVFFLRDRVTTLAYYGIAVGAVLFVASFLSNIIWNVTALRQVKRLRVIFLGAVLRQEVGYYDVHPPAELPSRLAE